MTDASTETTPSGPRRVVIRPYPKIVFFYLTWIASLVCAVLMLFQGEDLLSNSETARVCGLLFFWLFAFNLLVVAFEFTRILAVAIVFLLGMLVFLSDTHELLMWMNNNLLMAVTVALLAAGAALWTDRLKPAGFAIIAGTLVGYAIIVKPTFVISGCAFMMVATWAHRAPERAVARFGWGAAGVAVAAVVSSVFWLRNLFLYGKLLNTVVMPIRLVDRLSAKGLRIRSFVV